MLARVFVLQVLLLAAGRLLAAGPDETSLQYYPTIERVRADVEAERRDDRPGETDGRISGRYLLLAEVLENSWGGAVGNDRFELRAPAGARRLRERYLQASGDRRINRFPVAPQPECDGRTIAEQTAKGICARVNYMAAQSNQRFRIEQVRQVAERYFPARYRDAFVENSPARQMDEYQARQEQEREVQRRKVEADSRHARHEAMMRRLGAGVLLAVLLIPLAILALLIRLARRNRGRNTSLTRIMSVDDLHLFVKAGQAIDVQRHSRTHVTTTTESRYVHPDSWQSRAPSTTTTVRTTDHLSLFVRTDEGSEVQESFVDLPLAVRPGNRVGIVYGGDQWSRSGVAVAVVNLDTRDVAVDTLQARRIASRFPLLRAAFWGVAVAAAGVAVDLATSHFIFTLPALALGFLTAPVLAFAWQWSLWTNVRGKIRHYAQRLAEAH